MAIPSRREQRGGDEHRDREPAVRPDPAAAMPLDPVNPQHHGGRVVFEVRFTSDMGGSALELLRSQLAMTTHVEHKLSADPNSPAHAQLDRDSSLLLERGSADDEWVLQARTWGRPSAQTVREWYVRVADVAHQLQPAIALPDHREQMVADAYAVPAGRVGHAANSRWAAVRRRLAGLP